MKNKEVIKIQDFFLIFIKIMIKVSLTYTVNISILNKEIEYEM